MIIIINHIPIHVHMLCNALRKSNCIKKKKEVQTAIYSFILNVTSYSNVTEKESTHKKVNCQTYIQDINIVIEFITWNHNISIFHDSEYFHL